MVTTLFFSPNHADPGLILARGINLEDRAKDAVREIVATVEALQALQKVTTESSTLSVAQTMGVESVVAVGVPASSTISAAMVGGALREVLGLCLAKSRVALLLYVHLESIGQSDLLLVSANGR